MIGSALYEAVASAADFEQALARVAAILEVDTDTLGTRAKALSAVSLRSSTECLWELATALQEEE